MTVRESGESEAADGGPSPEASPPAVAVDTTTSEVSAELEAMADTAGDGQEPAGDGGFTIDVPTFRGPLALLHHLIEREELDVTEVSLLAVTEQYLAHLHDAERIDLTALAEFVAVGARLLLLKSRALLPSEGEQPSDEDDGDPQGLIDAINEYRRFKEAAAYLGERDRAGQRSYTRSAAPPDVALPTGLDTVSVDALADLFREVLERIPEEEPSGEVEREQVTLAGRIGSLVDVLERDGRLSFRAMMSRATSRTVVIVDFLAVLELIKAGYLRAEQAEAFGDIDLVHVEGAAAPDGSSLTEDFAGV
jgi:segregation and condensation protein A